MKRKEIFYDLVITLELSRPLPQKQTKGKTQNRAFEKEIAQHLKTHKKDYLPFKKRLLFAFNVSGPKEYIENIDVDNVAKSLLDALKGEVYKDDKQVYFLIAEKHLIKDVTAAVIGIREIQDNEEITFVPKFGASLENYIR